LEICYHKRREALMNGLIYLVGLIVVVMVILSFLGLH
jgi:predicted nucleic acid-binding Zn ribbon protein